MDAATVERARRMVLLVQWAEASACLMLAVIGHLLGFQGYSGPEDGAAGWLGILKPTFLVFIVAIFPLLRMLQRRWRGDPPPAGEELTGDHLRRLTNRSLALVVLAAVPAYLGFVLFVLGAPARTLHLTVGLALLYLAVMTPRRGFARSF